MKSLQPYYLLLLLIVSACQSKGDDLVLNENIRLNQLGYYPSSIKEFVIVDDDAQKFSILNAQNEVVLEGELKAKGRWENSGEEVKMGDFSSLKKAGNYKILIGEREVSHPFSIGSTVLSEARDAALKSYYFQRASMPIEEAYGGIYKRAAGHPDSACVYHPSSTHSKGTLSSPGGWYDAGDYGKYIGNASMSTGQMLNLLQTVPNAFADGSLNIPESQNGKSDLWDELMYELNWISSMQDADGGVYHKLTAKTFSGFVMPADYDLERMIIGKGTAATLNFAAVMAQAARLYFEIDPQWASTALSASKRAWKWAVKNPEKAYLNPEDVVTGQYEDDDYSDDFYWAAAELYLATQEKKYLKYLEKNPQVYQHQLTNSWKFFVRNNAFHSILTQKDRVPESLWASLSIGHLDLADEILNQIQAHPYHIALDRFEWGSNSDVLNQAYLLCMAHWLTGEHKYLDGAVRITDYIFGKNATGYSFLTGFGAKQIMFPHHRPSGADGIEAPVPGFVAGGPNDHRQDAHEVEYRSEFAAKAHEDVEASFASNEVCINWNAPAVFVLSYLEKHVN